jgi:histidine triad (HIT) family protein
MRNNKSFNPVSVFSLYFLFVIAFLNSNSVEAQSKLCVFCEIAQNKTQESRVVYRDKTIVAFMDYAPITPGHVLVVPLMHATDLLEMPDSIARDMLSVAKKIAAAIKRTDIKAEGIRFLTNAGEAAGQDMFHAHLHIIPRFTGDNFNAKKVKAPANELDEAARKIREALAR